MKYFRYEKITELLIEIIVLAAVFLTPLYFGVFLKTANVFELNKIVLFKILVLILFFLTIIKITLFSKEPVPHLTREKLRGIFLEVKEKAHFKNFKLFLPLLFLLSLILSVVFSIDKDVSIFGSYARQQGLISYLYYFLFFILLVINIKTARQIKTIIFAAVGSSFLVAIYGLVQAFGFDPLLWSESTQIRATSTLGQPNLLAMYLLLTIPLSVYLISALKIIWQKIITVFILAAQLICLFYTYSLSGWVAFVVGLVGTGAVFLFFYFKNKKNLAIKQFNKIVLKLIFPIIILFTLVGGLIYYTNTNKNTSGYWVLKARWESLTNFQSASLSSRFLFWRASWEAVREKPFFGYGPETQSEVLVKYYQKDWGIYEDVNIRPDRAHNLFIDILLTTGLAGLFSYLGLLYLFLKLIFNNIRNNTKYRGLFYALLFAVISYLAALQLNFTFVVGEIYFWLYLALVFLISNNKHFVISTPHAAEEKSMIGENSTYYRFLAPLGMTKKKTLYFVQIFLTGILVLIIAVVIGRLINNQIKLLTADYYLRELQLSRQSNQYFSALKMYEFIKESTSPLLRGAGGDYDRQFALIMSDWLPNFADARFRKFGEEKMMAILPTVRLDTYDNIYTRGKIYYTLTGTDEKYFTLAIDEFNKLISYAPDYPQNYRALADVYFKQGDYKTSIKYYQMVLDKLPALDTPNFNQKHKFAAQDQYIYIYLQLGGAYYKIKNVSEAEKYYKLAWGIDNKSPEIIKKLAVFYFNKDDFKQAIWYNERGMELASQDYYWPLELSKIYEKLGDKARTEEYEKKASELADKIDKQNVK